MNSKVCAVNLIATHQYCLQVDGLSTYFDRIGSPTGDCAMPTNDLKDSNNKELPFVALNINKAQGSVQDMQGMYNKGGTCGRWMKITLGQNCSGGSNSQRAVCQGGSALHRCGRSAIRLQVLLAVWRRRPQSDLCSVIECPFGEIRRRDLARVLR